MDKNLKNDFSFFILIHNPTNKNGNHKRLLHERNY